MLVVGAGGLGVPILIGLAHRGFRRVTVWDPDRVELSNLHRQILYTEADIGAPKAAAMGRAIRERFALEIDAIRTAFTLEHRELVADFDVVLDATDAFETKLALNDACVDFDVPYVFGGVVGHEAQAMAVLPNRSACLRCLFDDVPAAAPTCDELGILGPIAGIAAHRQVVLAERLLEGDASALDRIWIYDGRADRSREVGIRQASDCRGCGNSRYRRPVVSRDAPADAGFPVLDLVGWSCPHTYRRTNQALSGLSAGERLWVVLSSDEAARSVPRSAIAAGHKVLSRRTEGSVHRVLIERG